MPTTIVYPSIDVSATASISMIVGTAASLAGSLTASSLTVTGTATFSGTTVHVGTVQFLGTTTFSGTAVFLTAAAVSGTLSAGVLGVAGQATFAGSVTMSGTVVLSTRAAFGGAPGAYFSNESGIQDTPRFQILATDAEASFGMSRFTNNANPARIYLAKSRGTTIGAAGAVTAGDTVAMIIFSGNDGTDWAPAAYISAVIDGTVGTDDMPGRLVFATTADGTNGASPRWRITNVGHFIAETDASYDIGADGATRPRDVFISGDLHVSGTQSIGTALIVSGTTTLSGAVAINTTLKVSATASVGALVIGGHAFNLSLSGSVADGQFLRYNNTNNKWRNETVAPGGTSASLDVSTITVTGSATFSGTTVFLTETNHLGTASFSATVNMATALRVSGTASVGTFKIAGFPAGLVLLGSASLGANLAIRFSGSWSDYGILELRSFFKATPSGSVNLDLFTDGGTTAFLTVGGVGSATVSHMFVDADIHNGTAFKGAVLRRTTNAVVAAAASATANTGFINCIGVRVGTSLTLSSGQVQLYGRRR